MTVQCMGDPRITLLRLLGEIPGVDIASLEVYLAGEGTPASAVPPDPPQAPNPGQLRAAYEALQGLSPADADMAAARGHYLSLFSGRLPTVAPAGPTFDEITAYTSEALGLGPSERLSFDGLSQQGKEGAYILLRSGAPRENVRRFLANRAASSVGGPDAILRLVALLYDRKVGGIESGFMPTPQDEKFLSTEEHRINSMLSEYFQALWLASNTDATTVQLARRISIKWSGLTTSERGYINTRILPNLDEPLRNSYQQQLEVESDITVFRGDGGMRIVEVKASAGTFAPQGPERAKLLLQAFRHALLVRQHGFSGIEYVIEAEGADGDAIASLREALDTTGVRYLIRIEGGGENRYFVGNGLTYDVTAGGISEARSRPLPGLPRHIADDEDGRDEVGTRKAKREARPQLPWTRQMQGFLDGVIPAVVLRVRRLTLDDFIRRAQGDLSPRLQDAVAKNIEDRLEGLSAPTARAIRSELAIFRHGRKGTPSRNTLLALVRIAAMMTGTPLDAHAVATGASSDEPRYSDDMIQRASVELPSIEGQLKAWQSQMGSDLEAFSGFDAGQLISDPEYFRGELARLSPDSMMVVIGGENLGIREVMAFADGTAAQIEWEHGLIRYWKGMVARYDQVRMDLEVTLSAAPRPEPAAVETVYRSLPPDVITKLRQHVIDLGPLAPSRGPASRSRVVAAPATPTVQSVFSQEGVDAIYDRLVLLTTEEDTHTVYFFPNDLAQIESDVRSYLKRAGWGEDRIRAELPAMTISALTRLGGRSGRVRSLDEIIPPNFRRTDLVEAQDQFSGMRLDVTRAVSQLYREGKRRSSYIRVVVVKNGRRVYFVDWEGLRTSELGGELWHMVYWGELKAVFSRPAVIGGFLEAVYKRQGGETPLTGSVVLLAQKTGSGDGARFSSLQLVTPEEAKNYGTNYIKITLLSMERPEIIRLKGRTSLDIGHTWLAARGHVITSPVEKALLASAWGRKMHHSEDEDELSWGGLKDYLRLNPDPIGRLLEVRHLADPAAAVDPEDVVFVAVKDGEDDHAHAYFRGIFDPESAAAYESRYAKLIFSKVAGRRELIHLEGSSSLELGLAWLQRNGHTITDPIEKALLISTWAPRIQLRKGEARPTWSQMKDYLRAVPDPIGRLLQVRHMANPRLEEDPNEVVLIVQKDGTGASASVSVGGLVTREEADGHHEGCAHLIFSKVGGRRELARAYGNSAFEFALSWLAARGHAITSPVEMSLLADRWGSKIKQPKGETMLRWGELKGYLRASHDPIARLLDVRRLANPMAEARPDRVVFVAKKRCGVDDDGRATFCGLFTEAEVATRYGEDFAKVVFSLEGGRYRPTSHWGSNSSDIVEALARGPSGNPPAGTPSPSPLMPPRSTVVVNSKGILPEVMRGDALALAARPPVAIASQLTPGGVTYMSAALAANITAPAGGHLNSVCMNSSLAMSGFMPRHMIVK